MSSGYQQVADDVVALIEAGTFSMTVATSLDYLPRWESKDVPTDGSLWCIVRPVGMEGEPDFREQLVGATYSLDVAVIRGIRDRSKLTDEINEFLKVVEEIQDYITANPILGHASLWPPYTNTPIFEEDVAHEKNTLLSVTTFQYRSERGG